VSQNRDQLSARTLVRDGSAHQYLQNDKFVACTSILSLLLAIGSSALTARFAGGADPILVSSPGISAAFSRAPTVITVFALLLLVDAFLAVTRYYLKVMTSIVEHKMFVDWVGLDQGQRKQIQTDDTQE
jgi:hypothetical protein